MEGEWNPRWLAYCRATGAGPDEAWVRDGNGARFLVWISERWREWAVTVGGMPACKTAAHHAAFDAWLVRVTSSAEPSQAEAA